MSKNENKQKLRVSVILPVFNADQYLSIAIESVLDQSYSNFELLLHDDGSTDSSLRILQRYAKLDSRIHVTSAPNCGIVATLNFLTQRAKGEYLARMDADDICFPDRLEKQVRFLDDYPHIGVVGTYVRCIDKDNRLICDFKGPLQHEQIDKAHLTNGAPRLWHPSIMMRSQELKKVAGYSTAFPYVEDYDLWLRMAEKTRLATLPEVLIYYRLHVGNTSFTKRSQQVEATHAVLLSTYKRRGMVPPKKIPRENKGSPTVQDLMIRWVWWSLQAGNLQTSRFYAFKVLRCSPLSMRAWKMLIIVLRRSIKG